MTDENMNMNQSSSEISPPISPSLARRFSFDSDYMSGGGGGGGVKTDINFLQLIQTSPNLQRELMYLLEQQQRGGGGSGYIDPLQIIASSGGDSFERELSNRLRLRRNLNDSLGSLTDSDFYNSDVELRQKKLHGLSYTNGGGGGRGSNNVKDDVAISLTRVGRLLEMLSNLPWPRMSFTAMGICFLIATFISPRACVQNILFPTFRLVFGTLYPAYASYKAVRTKNVKEYVKWMMYWIVFAFFTCIETFTDIFLSWLPLYYEVKVIVVLWLLNPATKGSSVLYRKFVHPMLTRREQEIDEYLNQAKERGYTAVIQLGSKGVNYATNVIMQTALKGGGNLVQTIKRSYSLSDLSEPDIHRTQDEVDELTRPQHRGLRPRTQAQVGRSSSSGARHSTGMYFSEIDVGAKGPVESLHYNIKSTDDISSGYSSAEPIPGGLSRTSSMTSSKGLRFKAKKPEDENFSEYDENEYLIREDILSQLNLKRSQSLCDPIQVIPEHSTLPIQNSLIQNTSRLEDNLGSISSQTVLEDLKTDEIEVNNEKVPTNFTDENIGKYNVDINEILTTPQMDPEMQSKYEMFRKWLEQGEVDNKVVKNESKVELERQISDEDFKDTISIGSNEDNALEKFDDAVSPEVKQDDLNWISLESTEKEQNKNTNLPQTAIVKEITEETSDPKFGVESSSVPTLKENISIAVDSVTKLKEHILKLNDGRTKTESEVLPTSPHQSLSYLIKKSEQLDDANITEGKVDNLTEAKKPVHHSKGKAPEPPATLTTSNVPTPYTDLFKPISLFESFKPIPPPRPPSPKVSSSNINQTATTSDTNTRPASPLLTSLASFSSPKDSPSPISSRPSSPNPTSLSVFSSPEPNTQLHSSPSKISSPSRSPSPKPAIKPRRNIFRSYLPSFLRSESPKSKEDEEYPGKETEI